MASSIYASLQSQSRGFRILTLEPSTDRLAPVRCKLNRASFDDGDLNYAALSYVWGNPLETTAVLVNGIKTQVTLNLEAALRHIRQSSCAVVLWVDALCINQEDVAEKNHQVEMMREIYSGAEFVIAWLGSASEDSDLAMEALGRGPDAWKTGAEFEYESGEEEVHGYPDSTRINDGQGNDAAGENRGADLTTPSAESAASVLAAGAPDIHPSSPTVPTNFKVTGTVSDFGNEHQYEHHITDQSFISSPSGSSSASDLDSSQDSDEDVFHPLRRVTRREASALTKLMKRSWWSRIWVVQEVLLAREVVFVCGDAVVPGDTMIRWRKRLNTLSVLFCDHDAGGNISPAIVLLNRLRWSRGAGGGAMDYLFAFGRREASRPHDHIYGLLGIIPPQDQELIGAPDYACRAEDLFVDVATRLMVDHFSLELLTAAGMPAPLEAASSVNMDLPSWVPNWTQPWSGIQHGKFPGGGVGSFPRVSFPEFEVSRDLNELMVEGFKFDTIESVKPVPQLAQGKMPIWEDDLVRDKCATDDQRLPTLRKLIVALLIEWTEVERLDDEETSFKFVAAFFHELEEYRASLSRCEADGEDEDSDYLAGFLEWTGETRDGRSDEEILQKVFSVEAARSFVEWYHAMSSADLQQCYMVYAVVRTGWVSAAGISMFRTCKGSFGLVQAPAATGDILCAIPTCRVPLVLREVHSSKHLLVGPSSPILETLHGEVARAADEGEIKKEPFTLV